MRGRASAARRRQCPSAEEFARFFSRETPEEDSGRFLDHILVCRSCRREFAVLCRLSTRVEPLLALLDKLRLTPETAEMLREAARAKLRSLRRAEGPLAWFRSPLGKMASLAAVGLVLVLGSLVLFRPPGPRGLEEVVYRGGDELILDLAIPRGETDVEDLAFVWRRYPGAETYEFELLNSDLNPLWSDVIRRRTRLELPSRARLLLRPKSVYFWKVTAVDAGGRVLASGLQSFRLK